MKFLVTLHHRKMHTNATYHLSINHFSERLPKNWCFFYKFAVFQFDFIMTPKFYKKWCAKQLTTRKHVMNFGVSIKYLSLLLFNFCTTGYTSAELSSSWNSHVPSVIYSLEYFNSDHLRVFYASFESFYYFFSWFTEIKNGFLRLSEVPIKLKQPNYMFRVVLS